MITAQQLIQDCQDLPTLPEVYLRVREVIDDPKASMGDLARALSVDTAMTARVLKVVNSPLYGLSGKIETVSRAASMLGMQPIHDLVLATSVATTFSQTMPSRLDMKAFWRNSVECGLLARVLAKTYNLVDSERLFVGGLLSDIGHLVMFQTIPDLAARVFTQAQSEKTLRSSLEQTIIGCEAAEVGALLLQAWNLPFNYQHSTRYQMNPSQASESSLEVSIIHVARVVVECQLLEIPRDSWMSWMAIQDTELQDMTDEDLDRLIAFVQEGLNMTLEMLTPGVEQAA